MIVRPEPLLSGYGVSFHLRMSRHTVLLAAGVLAGLAAASGSSRAEEIAWERVQLSDEFYSEGGTFGDFNGDDQGDVAIGPWIYYGPTFEQKSRFYQGDAIDPAKYSENFLMYADDVNADGQLDLLVLGFPGRESWWFENPGRQAADQQLWARHTILDSVDNESPLVVDIDGDQILDLVCSSQGRYGYATHAGQTPSEPWRFIAISPNNGYQRFTHGLGVGDVNNDGHADLMEKDGWWQNPGRQQDPQNWDFHPFAFSSGGSQMFAVDLDGDGRNEVVTGLVAHGYGLVYYRPLNAEATQFERVDIMTDSVETSPCGTAVSQLHAVEVGDINRDGVVDIVTGKRWWAHATGDAGNSQPATLLWLETQRVAGGVRFISHVVDNSSGVGTQVTVGDVNRDGLLDIVSGNKRGGYLFLQRPSSLAKGQFLVPNIEKADAFDQRPARDTVAVKDDRGGFLPALDARPLNLGFESEELRDWEMRGSLSSIALSENVASDDVASTGVGKYWIDTGHDQPQAVGELISRPFVISRPKLVFLMGGKGNEETRVELISEESGQVLASGSPEDSQTMQIHQWDLGSHQGQLVRIRIIDHSGEGFLRVDDFRLED